VFGGLKIPVSAVQVRLKATMTSDEKPSHRGGFSASGSGVADVPGA
jgi:hypothetical protein